MTDNFTNEQKPIAKKYSVGYAWLSIFDKPDATPEQKLQVQKVMERMKQLEEQLKLLGASDTTLGELIERAKKFTNMSVGEMNGKQLELLCQLIFGKGSKLE